MDPPIRVIVLDDRAEDASLIVGELRRAGYDPAWRRVETEEAFVAALDTELDLILADYHLSSPFDGMQALRIARLKRPDVPVIIVDGTLGEEVAVDCMKEGAADFVLKDRLSRLAPAVRRAFEEYRLRHDNEVARAELRAAHRELQEGHDHLAVSERRYRRLFDNLLNGYTRCRMIFDGDRPVDFEYLEVNRMFSGLTGLRDVVGRRATDIFPGIAEMHPELLGIYGRVARGALPHRFELFFVPLGLWLSITAYGAAPGEFVAVFDNITERRDSEAQREQLTRQLQLILDSTDEGIYGTDLDGHCTFVNRAACVMFGAPAEVMLGRTMHEAVHHSRADGTPYPSGSCPIAHTRAEGTAAHIAGERFWRQDGTSFAVEYSAYPVRDDGTIKGAVVTFTDVTGRQELEAQLRQAQKLEAIGQLTGGVAHDFNNLLTAILGFSQFLDESLDPGDARRNEVAEIRSAGERAAHLTQQLLAFGRRQIVDQRMLDLNALVTDLVQMLRRLIGEHIDLRTTLADDLAPVRVDPGQIHQVLVNLVVNARDAMAGGGQLSLETAMVVPDRDLRAGEPAVVPGPFVRLRVRDTGTGMDAAVKARAFEPFFTTKPVGKGTGLGLSTVYGITRQSGGFVRLGSQVGHGTTVDVYLPCVEGEAEPVRPGPPRAPAGGTETILLVEDDAGVGGFARRVLEKRGYHIVMAVDPESARAAIAAHPEAIDLLLTDVVMPGGSGPALYQELAATHPSLRVVFMSGYSEEVADLQETVCGHAFLQKPFDGVDLAAKVREALDA